MHEEDNNYILCETCDNTVLLNHCNLCPICSQFMTDEEVEEKCNECE